MRLSHKAEYRVSWFVNSQTSVLIDNYTYSTTNPLAPKNTEYRLNTNSIQIFNSNLGKSNPKSGFIHI